MKDLLFKFKNWPTITALEYVYSIKKRFLRNKNNNFILIASFPKSACNYLAYLLSDTLNYKREKVNVAGGYYHDTMYLPRVIDVMLKKTIITNHLRLTLLSRPIIKELDIKPIILVRNIYDVVISYHDHIKKRGIGPLDPDKYDLSPEFCKNFFEFELSKRYDYIIDMVIPWYISFYVSWYHYTLNIKEIDGYWLRFEDLTVNPKKYLNEIYKFYNFDVHENKIDALLEKNVRVNFNKGIIGRGDQLTPKQKQKIKDMTSYHENIDFSMMGL